LNYRHVTVVTGQKSEWAAPGLSVTLALMENVSEEQQGILQARTANIICTE